ncbi:response regulator transcription factor, partial [Acinetobacter baumannii]
ITDIILPNLNGIDLCKEIRSVKPDVPIIMLTALGTTDDKVEGFDAGADDYLIKPFDLEELSARMRALSRRQAGRAESLVQVREVVLNPATHEVTVGGKPVNLSAREF